MRKVLIFALTIAIALGGIAFAHIAVTDSQDELVIYPILETGDASVLSGSTAVIQFSCGEHLLWYTRYGFGGETDTDFVYDRKGVPEISLQSQNQLDLWLSAGMSASTTGSFFLNNHGYGPLFKAVADETPTGGTRTRKLRMADYVDYYLPDFQLTYQEYNRQCHYSMNFWDYLEPQDWYLDDSGIYESLLKHFRFPVQQDHLVDITITKDDTGSAYSFEFYAEYSPELNVISYVGSEGIWFVPLFRDETGTPLSYESPEGHGIYFIPWQILYTYETRVDVAPNFSGLRRVIPLPEDLQIDHIEIDGPKNECRMLTREEGSYFLSLWDLTTGQQTSRLEVLPYDATQASYGEFVASESYLLVTAQGKLALVDPAQDLVLLTAPDAAAQRYSAAAYNAAMGDLCFDDGRLYLLNPVYSYHDGAFWTAVWEQDALLYYAEYDCSLMRGNDDYYYREITTDLEPMVLLLP